MNAVPILKREKQWHRPPALLANFHCFYEDEWSVFTSGSSPMNQFTHFDENGASRMVDVGDKAVTRRLARASGLVRMQAETLRQIRDGETKKGNVLEVARLAGIMGAKKTSDLIPLCHPISLDSVTVDFSFPDESTIAIEATTCVDAKTGVEMEALAAVTAAALTIYDMCKAVDREMVIEAICLQEKSGGRSGHFVRENN
ncbi:MAG: cyclic pyranopterin phosphate synthase [Pirellulaceae bacterium]